MSSQNDPKLGEPPPADARRDAIHIALAPVTAGATLKPGQRVGLIDPQTVGPQEPYVGIIDPYLTKSVKKGETCWLCLFPYTVTSLRHEWEHPAFPAPAPEEVGPDKDYLLQKLCRDMRRFKDFSRPDLLAHALEDAGWQDTDVINQLLHKDVKEFRIRMVVAKVLGDEVGMSECYLEDFASRLRMSYDRFMQALAQAQASGESSFCLNFDTPDFVYEEREEMWEHYKTVIGVEDDDYDADGNPVDSDVTAFRCSC